MRNLTFAQLFAYALLLVLAIGSVANGAGNGKQAKKPTCWTLKPGMQIYWEVASPNTIPRNVPQARPGNAIKLCRFGGN